MKAAVITTKGVVTFTDVADFAEIRRLVGGYVAPVRLSDGSTMYVDEDGGPRHLPLNPIATDVCGLAGRIDLEHEGIVGDVVIVGPTRNGDDTDLTEVARSWVTRITEGP
jgi:hypothetical protein